MSILTDALNAGYAAQDAAGAQRRIEWTPEANRVSLKRWGRRERMLARLREGEATTLDLMILHVLRVRPRNALRRIAQAEAHLRLAKAALRTWAKPGARTRGRSPK